jgi:hypothetical protein
MFEPGPLVRDELGELRPTVVTQARSVGCRRRSGEQKAGRESDQRDRDRPPTLPLIIATGT